MNTMNTESLTVYTTPGCGQCTATSHALDAKGIQYSVVDVTENTDALDYVKQLGYTSAPVVVVDDQEHWAGFRIDLIDQLAARLNS